MDLQELWFVLIAVFWGGYLLLEGFDFGVGMLLPFVGRDEDERGLMLESIGPVWDGNEVWLVVAGAATFAAFPAWYATMFSGYYLALLLVLVFLMIRVVSFEWRGKSDRPGWRRTWTAANATGSVGAPFIWGVALSNLLNGVPLDSKGDFAGSFWDLFSPYTVAAGAVVVLLCAFHGATFLTLHMAGDLRRRAADAARRLSVPAVLAGAAFLIWTVIVAVDNNDRATLPPAIPAALAIVALIAAFALVRVGREGWAFAATVASMVGLVATIFTGLYPRVLVSSPDFANSLTISNAASAHYTLAVITVVALVVTPVVLLYQGWTYYVFRARLRGPGVGTPDSDRAAAGPATAD
jgi:cytochrome bd ubiquinol oxidase subunit II